MANLLVLFLYLFGIAYVAIGALLVFVTELVRNKFYRKMLEKVELKKLGAIPLVFGLLFFLAARYNRHATLIVVLGFLSVTKGIVMLAYTEKMKKMTDWFLNKASANVLKLFGVIAIVLGSIVLMGID